MGYTHYWYRNSGEVTTEQWQQICRDFTAMKNVLEKTKGVEVRFEYDQDIQPFVGMEYIRFNGIGEDGHETMVLERDPTNRGNLTDRPFSFCKTAYKPYDALVTALLISAEANAPGAWEIRSDGDLPDWEQGFTLYEIATQRQRPVMPHLRDPEEEGAK